MNTQASGRDTLREDLIAFGPELMPYVYRFQDLATKATDPDSPLHPNQLAMRGAKIRNLWEALDINLEKLSLRTNIRIARLTALRGGLIPIGELSPREQERLLEELVEVVKEFFLEL